MFSWKRQADTFHLVLGYGDQPPGEENSEVVVVPGGPTLYRNGEQQVLGVVEIKSPLGGPSDLISACKYKIQLDWLAGEDEDQVALKLQSQLMVTLPAPYDGVAVRLEPIQPIHSHEGGANHIQENGSAELEEKVVVDKDHDEEIRVSFCVQKTREHLKVVSLSRTAGSGPSVDDLGVLNRILDRFASANVIDESLGLIEHWRALSVLNLSSCSLTVCVLLLSCDEHVCVHSEP
jgi:hypothetical protein